MNLLGRIMYHNRCVCRDCCNLGHDRQARRFARRRVRAREKAVFRRWVDGAAER